MSAVERAERELKIAQTMAGLARGKLATGQLDQALAFARDISNAAAYAIAALEAAKRGQP